MRQKIFVGISGGVDSAVSAALLKRQGHDVVGVFIKIWRPTFLECTWEKDRIDAMRVAVSLGIPFKEVDLSEEYEREVIRDMTESYRAGRTPNPDVECNEKIKFGAFFEWAISQGADAVATGHYARTHTVSDGTALLRGVDADKDQSYFLYRIPTGHLSRVRFPVGELLKADVRKLARGLSLPVAEKKDSQGLCFVGDVSLPEFLKRYIEVRSGDVLDREGRVIGEHEGAALYTIGQRHGFIVSKKDARGAHFVTNVDAAANTITVSSDVSDCRRLSVWIDHAHQLRTWKDGERLSAQSRYREKPFAIGIRLSSDGIAADFRDSQLVSSGQSLVLYDGERCLGGGRIRCI